MCRYAAAAYKPHFACFECRKTFKRRLPFDIEGAVDSTIEARCPQCRNLMADMGLDFKSPKMSDIKAWKHLKDLYQVGLTFHSCGCTGPGYIPRDKENLLEHLSQKMIDFVKNRKYWLSRHEPATKQQLQKERQQNWIPHSQIPQNLKGKHGEIATDEAIKFWNEKIDDIKNKINQLRAGK